MKQNSIRNYLDKFVFFFVKKINAEINSNIIFSEANNGKIKLISYIFNIIIIINNYAINIFDNYKYIKIIFFFVFLFLI